VGSLMNRVPRSPVKPSCRFLRLPFDEEVEQGNCPAEADMERQHSHSPSFKSFIGMAFAGLGILVLSGSLDWTVSQLRSFLCGAAGNVVGALPYLIPSFWHAMELYVMDQSGPLESLLQMLPSSSLLALVAALAI
jgi:hypothetical protein